jgi:hypothetical protein
LTHSRSLRDAAEIIKPGDGRHGVRVRLFDESDVAPPFQAEGLESRIYVPRRRDLYNEKVDELNNKQLL